MIGSSPATGPAGTCRAVRWRSLSATPCCSPATPPLSLSWTPPSPEDVVSPMSLIERHIREKIVLVGVTLPPETAEETEASLDELSLLVDTAGADEVGRITPRDRKSTRLNSSHSCASRMPASAGQNK